MKINIPAAIVLIVYPAFLAVLTFLYLKDHSIEALHIMYILVGYYVTNISIGVGLHRLWSHASFKTTKFIEFILCIFSAAALQGPAIKWADDHFKHHAHTDGELDPHTPKRFKNKIKGFFWSHLGWMLSRDDRSSTIDHLTIKKLGRNKLLVWQFKNYWTISIFMHLVPPFVFGYILGGSLLSGYTAFLFIALGRALQHQLTFCVNSVCHFWGSQKYTTGSARDVWWLSPFLLGENYHNYHHAFASDYRNGVKWYHFDVHKWIIYLLYKFGLAWDLNITSPERIKAKVLLVAQENIQAQWHEMHSMYGSFRNLILTKIAELDELGSEIKIDFKNNLSEIKNNIDKLMDEINLLIDSPDRYSNSLLLVTKNNFNKLHKSFIALLKTQASA